MQYQGPKDGEPRPTSKITRKEAATILCTTLQNVINLERRGRLRSLPDCSKVVRYFLWQVEALAIERAEELKKGTTLRQLFAMFRVHTPHSVIADETGLSLEHISRAHRQFQGASKHPGRLSRPNPADEKSTSLQKRFFEESVREANEARLRRIANLRKKHKK